MPNNFGRTTFQTFERKKSAMKRRTFFAGTRRGCGIVRRGMGLGGWPEVVIKPVMHEITPEMLQGNLTEAFRGDHADGGSLGTG